MRLPIVCFVLGCAWLQQAAALPEWNVLAAGCAVLLAAALARGRARFLLACAAAVLLGHGYAALRAQWRLADELPRPWEGRDVVVRGVVTGLPQATARGTRFLLDVEASLAAPSRIALTWYAGRGAEGEPPRLQPGQRWQLTVRLKRPRGTGNAHAFAFEPWALERGIRATGYVRSRPAPVLLAPGARSLGTRIDGARDALRDWMLASLEGRRYAGVLVALAIGDQDAIGPADWETFWRTGVGHLMSISGLHITMLAALAFFIVRSAWAWCPPLAVRLPARKAGAVAGVLAALAYALLAGFAVPAQRTVILLAVVAAAVLADRQGSASRVLALSALVVVAFDPWAVLSPGAWLSFGAVGAIFYALALRTGRPGLLRVAFTEQAAVTVAMLPLLVALFQQVSIAAPLANALAIPVVSFAVVPLTLGGAFLAQPRLLEAAHALLAPLMAGLEAIAAWPDVVVESHAPASWAVVLAGCGCAWLLAPRGVPLRAFGALWLLPLATVLPPSPPVGEAWVDVLDVGNGLAVVIRTARHAALYDAGPSWSADSDAGRRIVTPTLRGEGVRHLDLLVISHADDDHAGGARSVLAARSPEAMLSTLPAGHPLHLATSMSRLCAAGLAWTWDGVRFEFVHPPAGAEGAAPRKENDRSCTLRVATASASMLLAGDVEAPAEAQMVRQGGLRSDVLLVPHHGSRTSSSAAFLAAVAPRLAVASVGHRNRFGHPHPAVLARYRERGIAVHRTDLAGALRVTLPATGAATVASIAPRQRYWSERVVPGLEKKD